MKLIDKIKNIVKDNEDCNIEKYKNDITLTIEQNCLISDRVTVQVDGYIEVTKVKEWLISEGFRASYEYFNDNYLLSIEGW